VVVMMVVVMGGTHRLCAWKREGNSGDGGQSESKFSHENYSWAGFLSAKKMAKASERVKRIFMNGRSERTVEHGGDQGINPCPSWQGEELRLGLCSHGHTRVEQPAGHPGGFFSFSA